MSKSLIAGDWHGSRRAAQACIEQAVEEGCSRVFQVGDFGVPFYTEDDFLDVVSRMAYAAGIKVHFLDGNHENFDTIEGWLENGERDQNGHIKVRPSLYYMPRGTVWKDEDGLTYAVMGGAASIDRDWRTLGFDYFPQELIAAGQVLRLFHNVEEVGKVDVLLTHDCSDYTPWGSQMVAASKCQQNRRVIDGILDFVKPDFHFHGHMHKMYDWWYKDQTHVYGLNLENERHSRGVLETNAKGTTFEYYPYRIRTVAEQNLVNRIGYDLG